MPAHANAADVRICVDFFLSFSPSTFFITIPSYPLLLHRHLQPFSPPPPPPPCEHLSFHLACRLFDKHQVSLSPSLSLHISLLPARRICGGPVFSKSLVLLNFMPEAKCYVLAGLVFAAAPAPPSRIRTL